ncbi:hypothetical protein OV450_1406 [Actinobacteria bacterium OV450]|nr:hypothetical protein OV450_1406 [Actinobacteria bacterium OV450]
MSRTGPRNLHADYEPSEKLRAAIAAWEEAVQKEEELRHAARKAIADELLEARISHGVMSQHVPWTEATVTGIAKEYKVPGLRQRT